MKKPINSKTYFQTLNLIYFAQVFTMIAFCGVVYYLLSANQSTPDNSVQWQYFVPLAAIVLPATGYFLFNMLIKKIDSGLSLKEKMPKYSRAVLIRSALLEVPAFFAGIAAFLSGQVYYLGASLLMIVLFVLLRPSKTSVTSDLNLSPKERTMIDNPNAIISEADLAR
jgi:hypothetical protein